MPITDVIELSFNSAIISELFLYLKACFVSQLVGQRKVFVSNDGLNAVSPYLISFFAQFLQVNCQFQKALYISTKSPSNSRTGVVFCEQVHECKTAALRDTVPNKPKYCNWPEGVPLWLIGGR